MGREEAAEAARLDALEGMEEVMEAEQVATAEAEVDMGGMQEGANGGDGGSGGRDGGNDEGGGGGVWVCGAWVCGAWVCGAWVCGCAGGVDGADGADGAGGGSGCWRSVTVAAVSLARALAV